VTSVDTAVISARELTKSFGELEAVKAIDLEVRRGEIFAAIIAGRAACQIPITAGLSAADSPTWPKSPHFFANGRVRLVGGADPIGRPT
jgi:hypothetical protein